MALRGPGTVATLKDDTVNWGLSDIQVPPSFSCLQCFQKETQQRRVRKEILSEVQLSVTHPFNSDTGLA